MLGPNTKTKPAMWLGEETPYRDKGHSQPVGKNECELETRGGKKADGRFHLCFAFSESIRHPLCEGSGSTWCTPRHDDAASLPEKAVSSTRSPKAWGWPCSHSSLGYSRDWEICCLAWPSRSAWRQKWPQWLRSTTPQHPRRRCNARFQKRKHHSEPGKTKAGHSLPSMPGDHQRQVTAQRWSLFPYGSFWWMVISFSVHPQVQKVQNRMKHTLFYGFIPKES